ncbi:hypothetical protein H257_12346 [Aphanomyces astaci]|uniref:Ubiquitin-like domain-containing protein n=1 Tax=Aphanomyces astaci TaxID=112090 RepID=W4G0P2_APHAT|nr:hypothetical protein H257_12346 [Aphanomyces astaci]ETV72584.1 hypothetical protein H257_12346 [Aphanomyces astaci]|eukprot:XP_009837812.1 hypothetical protein H257_12346 [Aphanomyces astaci]
MQVVWLDPTTNEAKGVLLVTPAEVAETATVDSLKKLLANKLLLENDVSQRTLRLHGQHLDTYLPCFQSNIPRFGFSYKLASTVQGNAPSSSIFVSMLGSDVITVPITTLMAVSEVCSEIEHQTGIPPHEHRLMFGGVPFQHDQHLCDYGIRRDSMLHFSLRVKGGLWFVAKVLVAFARSYGGPKWGYVYID